MKWELKKIPISYHLLRSSNFSSLVEVIVIVDKLLALELTQSEFALGLVEGLLLVELVAISCSHDVCMQVLLGHKKLSIANHMVLGEPGTIIEAVFLVSCHAVMVKADTATWRAVTPVPFMLCLWALDGHAEVCCQLAVLVVGSCIHQGFLAISSAECMQI